MSIYASLDGGKPSFLASNRGWYDFCKSVPQEAKELYRLVRDGVSENLNQVSLDIGKSLPSSFIHPDIEDIATTLLTMIDNRPKNETVLTINNGIAHSL